MIELFLVNPNEMLEIPTESVIWTGRRYSAARKIDVRMLFRQGGSRKSVKVYEGDTVLFKWKGKEVFRGTIFNRGFNKSGISTFTAYDNLQFLLLNSDTYVFSDARADQMAKRIFNDFGIPHDNSTIAHTKHVFKNLVFANETKLYDIILKALIETEKYTKQRYMLFSEKGKVGIRTYRREESVWVLESGVNIEDFTLETSLDDVATRVKMVAGDEKKKISAVVTDDKGRRNYGVLQYYENVSGDVNQAQLNDLAKKTLERKKELKQKLSVSALGIPTLISGNMVKVIEKETSINRNYFVESDSHHFQGNSHMMSLELIKYNHLPEVR